MAGETLTDDPFLRDLWYMPALAKSLGPGQMRREMLLGEPVLLGRLKSGRRPHLNDIRPFVGRLDELAVYDHILSREEIRRHYELGTVGKLVPPGNVPPAGR